MPRNCFGEEELAYLREVVEGQDAWRWGRSNFVPRFEGAFGRHLGRRYVHAVNSGTSANTAACASLGLEPGDEVICPAVAPIFVSFPVVALGCVPVFADVDRRTQIITAEGIEQRITEKTRAVVVVHLYGQPAPMGEILAVTRRHGLRVVEDCAQAYDAFFEGKKVGTLGDIACFSMQQSKHITAGEGGMVATDDEKLYMRAAEVSNSGMPWYMYDLERPEPAPVEGIPTRGHFSFGFDFRLSELQGAVALAQLEKIDGFHAQRRRLVAMIEDAFREEPRVSLARVYPGTVPNYWQYTITGPDALGWTGELNYLEAEFQRMQAKRRTSVGVPLPDHVQYAPGICPEAEASVRGRRAFFVHHSTEDGEMREQIKGLKRDLQDA